MLFEFLLLNNWTSTVTFCQWAFENNKTLCISYPVLMTFQTCSFYPKTPERLQAHSFFSKKFDNYHYWQKFRLYSILMFIVGLHDILFWCSQSIIPLCFYIEWKTKYRNKTDGVSYCTSFVILFSNKMNIKLIREFTICQFI